MPEACSNGVRISYDDRGEGGPALLFLPGWCVSRKVFADLPRLSAGRRRTIALDWRGHGESGAAPAPFGSNELVEDAIAVIEASGARSVVPVALSHAGWIAIELRRRLGDRIAKLVLIDWIVQEAPPPFLRVLQASQSADRWSIARDLLFSIWLRGADDDELKCFISSDRAPMASTCGRGRGVRSRRHTGGGKVRSPRSPASGRSCRCCISTPNGTRRDTRRTGDLLSSSMPVVNSPCSGCRKRWVRRSSASLRRTGERASMGAALEKRRG